MSLTRKLLEGTLVVAGLVGLLSPSSIADDNVKAKETKPPVKKEIRQELPEDYREIRDKVLKLVERYATKTPEQIQNDDSFEDWEKFKYNDRGDFDPNKQMNLITYSAEPMDKLYFLGPSLELIYKNGKLDLLSFCYAYGNYNARGLNVTRKGDSWKIELMEENLVFENNKNTIRTISMKIITYKQEGNEFIRVCKQGIKKPDDKLKYKLIHSSKADPDIINNILSLIGEFDTKYGLESH